MVVVLPTAGATELFFVPELEDVAMSKRPFLPGASLELDEVLPDVDDDLPDVDDDLPEEGDDSSELPLELELLCPVRLWEASGRAARQRQASAK